MSTKDIDKNKKKLNTNCFMINILYQQMAQRRQGEDPADGISEIQCEGTAPVFDRTIW